MRRLACTRCAPLVLRFGRARRGSRSGARLSLTPRRHQLREALRLDELPPDSPEARFCTDACLCRYLRARAWDVAKATKLLHGSLQWRASVAIDALCFKDVAPEAVTGKMFRLPGVDKKGRPVLLMSPGKENTRDAAGQLRFLQWTMEDMVRAPCRCGACRHADARFAPQVRAMASGRAGFPRGSKADLAPEQMTIMVDFAGYRCAGGA